MKNVTIILSLVLLSSCIPMVSAFEDTVQRYPIVPIYDFWDVYTIGTGGIATVVQYPSTYPTSKAIQLRTSGGYPYANSVIIETAEIVSADYFRFTLRNSWGAQTGNIYINYYDSDDILVTRAKLTEAATFHDGDTYEFTKSGTSLYVSVNGGTVRSIGSFYDNDAYIGIEVYNTAGGGTDYNYAIFDDMSTSSVIGINEEWTESYTNIDASYGIRSMLAFPTAEYTMDVKHVQTSTIINSTTIPSDGGAGDEPSGFVRWNRTDVFSDTWGLYRITLNRDGTQLTETWFTYFDSTIVGSVAFDQESYTQGQTADISYSITSADFGTYTYYLKLMNVYGTVEDSFTLLSDSGTESVPLLDYDTGTWFAVMSRTNKVTGVNEEFAYDYASITETVWISGDAIEAFSELKMNDVNVNFSQNGAWYNTTTAADGNYTLEDLSTGTIIISNANVTYSNDPVFGNESYELATFSFTPLAAEVYDIDLILFNTNLTFDNASVYGLVIDSAYHQPVVNATVNIYNSTWSDTTNTSSTGVYVFHNLNINETYTVNATAPTYINSPEYSVNVTTNETRQDIELSQLFTVTIRARDATTTAYINTFTAFLNGEDAADTTNGTVSFYNVPYGIHSFSVASEGYYSNAESELIDEDTTITIDLTQTASQYYSPHYVRFVVKSLFGTRYPGVTTTVYTGDTATGESAYTGTTGTDGAVGFEMSENTQYTITFVSAADGISETITLYPKDDEYIIYVIGSLLGDDEQTVVSEEIEINVTSAEINTTHAYINVSYNDSMAETTSLILYLNKTNLDDPLNQTTVDSVNLGANSSINHSFVVSGYSGQAYQINVVVTHTTLGSFVQSYAVKFPGMQQDFGWTKSLLYLSVFLIMYISLIFKASNVERGSFVVCVLAWVFGGLGMFGAVWTLQMQAAIGLATVISVAAIFAKKERSESR